MRVPDYQGESGNFLEHFCVYNVCGYLLLRSCETKVLGFFNQGNLRAITCLSVNASLMRFTNSKIFEVKLLRKEKVKSKLLSGAVRIVK